MKTAEQIERELHDVEGFVYAPTEGAEMWGKAVRYALRWVLEREPRGPMDRLRASVKPNQDSLGGARGLEYP